MTRDELYHWFSNIWDSYRGKRRGRKIADLKIALLSSEGTTLEGIEKILNRIDPQKEYAKTAPKRVCQNYSHKLKR